VKSVEQSRDVYKLLALKLLIGLMKQTEFFKKRLKTLTPKKT
jgi:hypothetical protein